MPVQFTNSLVAGLLGVTFAGLAWCATAAGANLVGAGGFPLLKEIVVEGSKHPESAADAQLNKQVETAMQSDRYFYDDHVTATTRNGVVVLRGMVFDEWDVRTAIRISRRIAGVKRVINQLEIGAQP
jgi:hypothetical protein